MEFSRQEYWSGLPFPSPGYIPDRGMEPSSPRLQADSLLSEPPGKTCWPNQPAAHFKKLSFIGTQPCPSIYTLSMAASELEQKNPRPCSRAVRKDQGILWPAQAFLSLSACSVSIIQYTSSHLKHSFNIHLLRTYIESDVLLGAEGGMLDKIGETLVLSAKRRRTITKCLHKYISQRV